MRPSTYTFTAYSLNNVLFFTLKFSLTIYSKKININKEMEKKYTLDKRKLY